MAGRLPYADVDLPAAAGDLAATRDPLDFSRVYEAWFDPCLRWLRALGIPDADLEDVGQEVFVVVRRKLAVFEGDRLAAWLYRIAARTASDHRRRAWFRRLWTRGSRIELDGCVAGGDGPAEILERREAVRLLDGDAGAHERQAARRLLAVRDRRLLGRGDRGAARRAGGDGVDAVASRAQGVPGARRRAAGGHADEALAGSSGLDGSGARRGGAPVARARAAGRRRGAPGSACGRGCDGGGAPRARRAGCARPWRCCSCSASRRRAR